MDQILKYIDKHLNEQITIEELAIKAGYSKFHFIRLFKAYTNATVTEYMCRRKLIRASEDIITGARIIEVALNYGWQSHSGFTKAFKKEFGFCPSLLRAMVLELQSLGGDTMSHVFMGSIQVGTPKEQLLEILQTKLAENGVEYKEDELMKVYYTACKCYDGVKRYSGEEYITHTINVSIILTELSADINVILAAMFCDINKKGVLSLNDIQQYLPHAVYHIIEAAQNNTLLLENRSDEVIVIKMAERLHNMRTMEYFDEAKRRVKAKETIQIFLPVARKMNNLKLIDELTNLTMKYYI